MNNKEKFLALVSEKDIDMLKKIEKSINNPSLLRVSINIARKVSNKLKELSLSKEELANKMNVSLNEVNEILKGTEDLSLSLIVKIQEALNLQLLNFHISDSNNTISMNKTFTKEVKVKQDRLYLDFFRVLNTGTSNYHVNSEGKLNHVELTTNPEKEYVY